MRFPVALFCAFGLVVAPAGAQQQASISGTVTDADEGLPLSGANVSLLDDGGNDLLQGAATGAEGRYTISGIDAGSYVVAFRFVGFEEERVPVTLESGVARTIDIALTTAGFDLNTLVVTASRQAEKVLDAPASISVLDAEEINATVVPSSAAVLRNTTGVDIAQTGIDRYEIVLRGFNNAFSGATYVLTDYRQGAIASLGVNAYQMMPITQIALEQIEVVRGPGSALYGPGVDAGVVHFITKDPYNHPGTTIRVGGGTRDMLLGSARHAGVLNDRLGYEIVGNYSRAEEWHFDPDDRLDSLQLASFRDDALPVDYGTYKYNLNGSVSYRFRPNVTLIANGGFASSKSIFLSGIGTLQSDGFGYSYGQLRLQADRLFAQTYVNANDAGDSFVYRDFAVEKVVDNSILWNTQVQYTLGAVEDRFHIVVGADHELTLPDTEGTITGRNEENDRIQEVGAYAQGTMALSATVDATAALRADYDNIFEEVQLSPRAAVVFKPSPVHSLRATFNRAFSSPGSNSLFLDIRVGAVGPLTIQARGSVDGFHYQHFPDGDLIASSLIPEKFGLQLRVGMPLDVVYAGVYDALTAIPTPELQAILQQQGISLSEQQIEGLVGLLDPEAGTDVNGLTESDLGFLNLTTLSIGRPVDDVVDIAPLRQTISHTFEVGYKGLVREKLLLAVDAYYVRKSDFVGPLLVESPFVLAPDPAVVIADLQPAMAEGIAGNAQLNAALQQFGLTPEQVAALLAGFVVPDSLAAKGSPIGIVQPKENAFPGQLLLAYRNYGEVSYFGVDLSTQLILNERLSFFGNLSWVNDNFFVAEELGEEGTTFELSTNAPKIKLKGGFDYNLINGLRVNASVRYIGGFRVRSGPYQGEVDPYTLVDLGAGYDFGPYVAGLRLDVSVLNAFNNVHREFIGAPRLGRLAIARMTYTLP